VTDRDEALRRARETMRRLQHEVRTPISQIMGYAELLEEELDDRGVGDLAGDLQKIRDAAGRLLDLADGRLREERDPGAPALPEPEAAAARPDTERDEATPAASPDEPAHILVVDDDASDRELLARRLERHGFRVSTARDGIDALRQIDAGACDLVLLEVMLAGMGGLEVVERVRRQHSRAELPIVLATALDDSEDAVEGLTRGANDYVTKPFDFPVVIARVRKELEAHRTARQVADLARQLEFRSAFIREALGRDVSVDLLIEMSERPDVLDLGRERRRVVAVVADIQGSRARASTLSPAQETSVLKNVFEGLSGVVGHYGGVVDSVSGDSLVALFGLPLSAADDVTRAGACALAMQLEMAEINERSVRAQLPAVEISVGVATGDVVVVALGSGDQIKYKAVGEPLARAEGIESLARSGEVWICSATREALGDLANVDRECELAGAEGAETSRAHRLLGISGAHLISLRSQLLHRSQQLRQLHGLRLVGVAAGLEGLLAVRTHGVGGERHHRNGARRLVALQGAGGLPAVHDGQAHVHEDQVGRLAAGLLHALGAIDRDGDLVAPLLQATRQHVAVHLLVFHQQDPGHRLPSSPDCRPRDVDPIV
jgi:DNA-binding response OmpR family regulator